jgi:hypothetical protein
MATLRDLLKRDVNPFGTIEPRSGNFWEEQQDEALTVDSIHQSELHQMAIAIERVAKDRRTRTLLLRGDVASGKSYLLGRLKKQLNTRAFFAYIGSWSDNQYIWRHVLRHTVDSLMYVPEGENSSQLLLWLKGLSAFQEKSLRKKILGERGLFIQNFRGTYPVGIYRAKEFFGVLYDLTNPDLYALACDWLRGEDLDNSDLRALGVKTAIESEDAAQNILTNFGKISSAAKYPIVLCFDQLDQALQPPEGYLALQALLGVNTTFHNEKLKNFTIIISLLRQTWNQHESRILTADRDRFDLEIDLKDINLDQAEALWTNYLAPLHRQANPKPQSPIEPLTRHDLEQQYPGGKTQPRYAIKLGEQLIQKHKIGKVSAPDRIAAFSQIWDKEHQKHHETIQRIRLFSSIELVQMLKQALQALQVPELTGRFIKNKNYGSYSCSYKHPQTGEKVGIFWNEDPRMQSFFYGVQACVKEIEQTNCDTLILIRSEKLGQASNKGYKLFQQTFTGKPHRHITPHLDSVHQLATYASLAKAASAGELVVGYDTPNLAQLEAIVGDSQVLHKCTLLQELGLVPADKRRSQAKATTSSPISKSQLQDTLEESSTFILNLIKTQQMLSIGVIYEQTIARFSLLKPDQIDPLIQHLVQTNVVQRLGDSDKPESQFICLIPK